MDFERRKSRRALHDFACQPAGGAMHVNLYNNVWGTNFPMWYEEDARFRFVLSRS